MSLRVRYLFTTCLLATLAGGVQAQGGPCEVPDNGTGTVTMPPIGCGYVSPNDYHMIVDGLPAGTTIVVGIEHSFFICGAQGMPCEIPGGTLGGNADMFDSTLRMRMQGQGALAGFARTIDVPVQCEVHTGPRIPGQPVQTFPTDFFSLQGGIFGDPDFDQLIVVGGTSQGLPSPGSTTLTQLPNGNFNVDSFFDVTYRINFVGAPGSVLSGAAGSTLDTVTMTAGGPDPVPSGCDSSDGSLASCPCANPGNPDTGCDIQQGTGGVKLDVVQQQTSPQNRVTLSGDGFPATSTPTSIVIRSATIDGGAPVVFGDGLRCVGPAVVRLAATFAGGGQSTHTFGHGAMAGAGVHHYQLWFRNTPIMFCDPAAAFNLSNTRSMTW
jgi:hypothetical protein